MFGADIKITLDRGAFTALFGLGEASQQYDELLALHCSGDAKIALRRTQGPVDGCIGFHIDGAASKTYEALETVQLTLNDDSEYDGGRICFVSQGGIRVPARPAGTLTKHPARVLHGVTRLYRGVRYSLFVVDYENGLGDADVFHLDAAAVTGILTSVPTPEEPAGNATQGAGRASPVTSVLQAGKAPSASASSYSDSDDDLPEPAIKAAQRVRNPIGDRPPAIGDRPPVIGGRPPPKTLAAHATKTCKLGVSPRSFVSAPKRSSNKRTSSPVHETASAAYPETDSRASTKTPADGAKRQRTRAAQGSHAAASVVPTLREVKLEEYKGLAIKPFDEDEHERLSQFFFTPVATSHAPGMHSRLRSSRTHAPRTVRATKTSTRFDCLEDRLWGVVKKNISELRDSGEHGSRARLFTLLRLLEAYLVDPTTPIYLPSELLPSTAAAAESTNEVVAMIDLTDDDHEVIDVETFVVDVLLTHVIKPDPDTFRTPLLPVDVVIKPDPDPPRPSGGSPRFD